MNQLGGYQFPKEERLSSRKAIQDLFRSPDLKISKFPVLCLIRQSEVSVPVRVVISVPKKKLKRAVHRNLVKRRLREAFRLNKHLLSGVYSSDSAHLDIGLVYLDDAVCDYQTAEKSLVSILNDINQRFTESN